MAYKTMFIDAPLVKGEKKMGVALLEVNGDQLARDINAAIYEKEKEGYALINSLPVQSSKSIMGGSQTYSYTIGVLLVFHKKETGQDYGVD